MSDNKIKELRIARGLSAKDLSKKVKMDLYTIYHYEWGRLQLGNANFLTIFKLCNALKCKPSDLFVDKTIVEKLIKMGM